MAKTKKKTRDLPPDHDFTFQEIVTGAMRFNDKNVLMIAFNTTSNEVYVLKKDDKTGQTIEGSVTLE